MQAIYLNQGRISFQDNIPTPTPGTGQVLLRILLTGICGTDLALTQGYADFQGIAGHEFVAEVVDVAEDVDRSWLGKRVVAEINQWCGHCQMCQQGNYRHCYHRSVIGIRNHPGAFAEYLTVNANTLHSIPDEITNDHAVFTEPLAAALRTLQQLEHVAYNDILLIGAGRLGQLIARVMASQGKVLRVVTRHASQEHRLNGLALTCIDATHIIPNSADVVIEASGHPTGLDLALTGLRPTGTLVLKSSYNTPLPVDLSQFVINEFNIIGSRCGPFGPAITALKEQRIDPLPLIEATLPLKDANKAFALAATPGAMKVLLKP